ncbi:hypothetical protein B5M47_02910 [candidate division CPR3 bacterium 4484_211]|uniref:Aldehyde dehydrogenase n=1 Tax=candidate division CPR3 bacterium 4484_211 TaxID=1968527 RepID=A0A1W9NXD9_UNCC3|nr:MAG: hypothetical protein B5M47_02910 [candidate division CPR3 bacterium 4484_211]
MKLKSINPHDQSVVGEVKVATKKDVEKAVAKAKKAFEFWREIPVEKRASYIEKFAKEILKRKEEVARLATLEMGKPYQESLDDIDWDQDYLKYYVQEGPKILQDEIIEKTKKVLRKVVHEPVGVCAVIAPWNFPFGNAIWGIMPNIIAGNTVVFKHSEYTPLCGQKVIDILEKIGLPEGVVNIVHGDGKVGAMLVDSDIDLVWFTGSTKVGEEIYQKCAKKFIRCLLELGGSSPAIVMDDADLDHALENIYFYRFLNCGQACDAIKRLFVHRKIYKDFVEGLVEKVKKAKVGNPFDKVDFGPLVSQKQLRLLEAQVNDAIKKGAKVEIGGGRPKDKSLRKGSYYLPTILTNVNFKMRVLKEEVFGPVLPVIPFKDIDEAIRMANKTEYGLSAQIYTQDLKLARKIAQKLEAGTVSINSSNYFSPACPFGGYKKSGIGREGGKYGFYELTQVKYIFESYT